jgi:antitoxin (DNA-binding transcriptional repressor) of toxin-antitoxin stability system
MLEFDLTEAKGKLAELVDEALQGEEILIKKDAHSRVKLVAVENSGTPQFGSAKGLIEIGLDFDAPLPDFESYS